MISTHVDDIRSAYEGTDIISYFRLAEIYHTAKSYIISSTAIYHCKTQQTVISLILKEGVFMSENKLLDLSLDFAVSIVTLVDNVTTPKSSYMTDQLARAGTSISANIHEAQYAQSKKDFVSKLEIALKEANETSYWLKLMHKTNRIDIITYQNAEKLCGNIRRLLIASCKTAKDNSKHYIEK